MNFNKFDPSKMTEESLSEQNITSEMLNDDPTRLVDELSTTHLDESQLESYKKFQKNKNLLDKDELSLREQEGRAWTEGITTSAKSNPNSFLTDVTTNPESFLPNSNIISPNPNSIDDLNTINDGVNDGGVLMGNVYDKSVPDSGPIRTQSTFSYDEDTFKYGLSNFSEYFDYLKYEDPTYLGFNLFISEKSTLLNDEMIKNFINQYISVDDIKIREQLYIKFVTIIRQLFNIEGDEFLNKKKDRNKPYYIKKINGLDKLNAKIVKYKEDKITIDLNEDVTMVALYLAELFNNLSYDYRLQKYIIPENLLRFDMVIKITDIRHFKKWDDNNSSYIINPDISSQYYILRDCNFDFENSQTHGADLTMGGNSSPLNTASEGLSFDIYYKSVERLFNPKMITSDILYNKEIYKDGKIRNSSDSVMSAADFEFSRYKKDSGQIRREASQRRVRGGTMTRDWSINPNNEQIYTENVSNMENDRRSSMENEPNRYGKDTLLETLGDTINENIDDFKGDVLNKIRDWRGSLMREVVYQIRDKTGIPEMYPNNVYAEGYHDLTLQNVAGDLLADLSNDLEDAFHDVVPKI